MYHYIKYDGSDNIEETKTEKIKQCKPNIISLQLSL